MKKNIKIIITLITLMLFTFGSSKLIDIITIKANTHDTSKQSSTKSDIPYIEVYDNDIKDHDNEWQTFIQDSENNKITSIQIRYKYPGQIPRSYNTYGTATDYITLEFDGENYLCFGKKYKYLEELTGRMPNAAKNTTYIILSNEQYSFKDISNSIYSSNSNDQIPYMLLFTR